MHGLDHAQTLAIVLPNLLQLRRDVKHDKLLQYASRVWKLDSGSAEARIDAAIARTRAFFESLGVRTRLSDYGIGADAIDEVVTQLAAHGMTAIGEDKGMDLEFSRRILHACL